MPIFVKITLMANAKGGRKPDGCYIDRVENVQGVDLIHDGWDDAFLLEPIDMTEEEFEGLPEFKGF